MAVQPDTRVSVRVIGQGITNEGTYKLPADSEIIALVKKAGGLRKGAITSGLNWHQKLYEGLTLTIPTRSVFRKARTGKKVLTNEDLIRFRAYGDTAQDVNQEKPELININQADRVELEKLPGIGKVLSQRIIQYRNEHNGFERATELRKIYGIGDVTYQELKAKITVE